MPLPVGPVALSSELAVACPERAAPAYPAQSRRLGEEGTVVLRVELDESGRVAVARVSRSSGHARLDEAVLGVVKSWRCTPALRDGRPVRAVALQPFKFVLQGN
jgi:protein TonB